MEEFIPYNFKESYDKICIDNEYSSYWILKRFLGDIHIFQGIHKLINLPCTFFSMHITRVKSADVLKQLTTVISHTNAERKVSMNEQIDIDVLNKITEEAKVLRYLVQVENEEIYEVCIYFKITGASEQELQENIKAAENVAYTNGFYLRPANFRQKEIYFLTVPIRKNDIKIKNLTKNIFTTSSLTSLFPFYSTNFFQEDGICIGQTSKVPCVIHFKSKYNNNKNILVFGSSGAGKSYFIKLMVLQYLYIGEKQVIIDPEGEYVKFAKGLQQRVINENNFNIFEIEEGFVNAYPDEFLSLKIKQICRLLQIEEIVQDAKIVQKIRELIYKIYQEYGITNDKNSLYRYGNEQEVFSRKKYIHYRDFPTVHDLKVRVSKLKLNNNEKRKVLKKISNYETCVQDEENFEQDFIVYDLSKNNENFLKYIFEKLQEYCTLGVYIYMDEIWELISSKITGIANVISEMFKTIRKTGAGIVAITQDITDVVVYNNGDFGKSILNNAYTKVYFKMEYLDIENLKSLIVDKNNILEKIKQLKRGHAIVDYGGNIFEVKVVASEYENKLIEGDAYEKDFNSNGK